MKKNKYIVCPKCALTYIPNGIPHVCPKTDKSNSYDFIEKNKLKRAEQEALIEKEDEERNKYKNTSVEDLRKLLSAAGVKGISSMPKKMLIEKALKLDEPKI